LVIDRLFSHTNRIRTAAARFTGYLKFLATYLGFRCISTRLSAAVGSWDCVGDFLGVLNAAEHIAYESP
jgi:hypothetical protein